MPNPSPYAVLREADRLMRKASIDPKVHRLVDCGCGLGIALKRYESLGWSHVLGIEGSYLIVILARLLAKITSVGSEKILVGDWRERWPKLAQEGDVLFFYTCPSMMKEASCFLSDDRGLDSFFVLTHTFSLPGMEAAYSLNVEGLYRTPVYLYHFKRPAS